MAISLTVNGISHQLEDHPRTPLLWVIRDSLGITGTKFSCGIGQCGSCTVHVDGLAVRSCITRLDSVDGAEITTVEGLAQHEQNPLISIWLDEKLSQCGYCQPGQLMAAAALLSQTPQPSLDEVINQMEGNLCRCGTYPRIKKAISIAIENEVNNG